jgi:hypothetical protein
MFARIGRTTDVLTYAHAALRDHEHYEASAVIDIEKARRPIVELEQTAGQT